MKLPLLNAKKNISSKISLGYILVVAVATVSTLICILSLRTNKRIDQEITDIQIPSMMLVKDFRSMVIESKKLTNNWIYLPNQQEKDRFKVLIDVEYPALSQKIKTLNAHAEKAGSLKIPEDIFVQFNNIVEGGKRVTTYLADDEAYSSDSLVDLAISTFEANVLPQVKALDEELNKAITDKESYLTEKSTEKETASNNLSLLMIASLVLILGVGVLASFFSTLSIVKPLKDLKNIIASLGNGEITEQKSHLNLRSDEIGEMAIAIDTMIKGLISKAEFADEIGKGNYEKDFHLLGDKDRMGFALIDMRNNLKKNAEEERKRNWATTGLAQIGEILRRTDLSADQLYNDILSFSVKYLHANQGALFIANQEGHEQYLELVACYAYNKRKFNNKKLGAGEGLLGQCYLEKDVILLTDVPTDYVSITSGLGEATPTCLLITPLKINEMVVGVMEIASFQVFEPFEIEFTQKLAESIGSTVSTVKVNEKTRKLLEDSQIQSEQLRSQEEEMRQNMEELQATQEEVQRKEGEYLREIAELKEKLAVYI